MCIADVFLNVANHPDPLRSVQKLLHYIGTFGVTKADLPKKLREQLEVVTNSSDGSKDANKDKDKEKHKDKQKVDREQNAAIKRQSDAAGNQGIRPSKRR